MAKPIKIEILGDASGFQKAMGEVEGALGRVGGMVGKAGKIIAAGSVAVATGSVIAFANFDQAMTNSLSIMGDVSDAMQGQMSDAAREVAKTTKFSATQAAESFYFLASAGMTAEQQIAALPAVAAFAQAGNFDMARATDLATDALSALGLAVDDPMENLENLNRVMDVQTRASQLANASVEQFSTALTNKAGIAMRNFGVEVETGTAALAIFADKGLKGEAAGTTLSNTIEGLARNAVNNSAAFAQLGVEVFDADGNMRNLTDIVGSLEGALGGMSDAERTATLQKMGFNKQALDGINLLMGSSEQMREYEAELLSAGGTTQEVADKQMQTFWAQLGLVKDNVLDVALTIGQALMPGMMALTDGLQKVVPYVQDFVEKGMERLKVVVDEVGPKVQAFVQEALVRISAWWEQHGPTIITTITNIKDAIVGWLQEVVPAIRSWVEDVLAKLGQWWDRHGPTIISIVNAMKDTIVTMATAVVRGVQLIHRNWSALRVPIMVVAGLIASVFIPHFIKLKIEAMKAALGVKKALIMKKVEAIKAAAATAKAVALQVAGWINLGRKALINAALIAKAWLISLGPIALVIAAVAGLVALIIIHFDTIKEWIAAAWEWVKGVTETVWNGIRGAVESVINVIRGAIESVFNAVRAYIEFVFNLYRAIITGVWNAISSTVRTIINGVRSTIETVLGTIRRIWQEGWDRVKGAVESVWEGIKDAVRTGKQFVEDRISDIVRFFTDLPGKLRSGMTGVAEIIRAPFREAFNAIKGLWNNSVGKISFTAPDWIPGIGGKGWSVPKLAAGSAFWGGGMAVVGDRGPETVYLPRGSRVVPHQRGGGAVGQTINVYATTNANPHTIAREIAWAMKTSGR
jgi:TP901 family phage tail tape measure protein